MLNILPLRVAVVIAIAMTTFWVHDDTPGQLRSHLQSSQLSSELGLGYLIRQAPHSGQRGQYRGSGLEWRTDGWGTLRASKGVLLSAYTRQNGRSTQLDTHETQRALKNTQALAAKLNQTASSHQAIPLKAYDGMEKLHQHLATEPGPVNGHAAQKPDAAGKLKEPVERFDAPVVVLETPNTLLAATSASQLTYAGSDLQLISQQDTHLSGHDTLGLTAGSSASLFTHHGGMSLIAANETVSIAAHGDTLQLTSEQAFTITSTSERIEILAQDGVTLFGGGAAVELKGANITFKASGTFTVKAASTAFSGGGGAGAEIAKLPDTQVKFFDEAFVLKNKTSGEPIPNQAYQVKLADGSVESGVTDDQGRTHLIKGTESGAIQLDLLKGGDDLSNELLVSNNVVTLLAGPGGSNRRMSDPVPWFVTQAGKKKQLAFADLATGQDKFITIGIHAQDGKELKVMGQQIVFYEENTNCFAYSLGVRSQGMVSFSKISGEDIFSANLVGQAVDRVGGHLGTGHDKLLPFTQHAPNGFVALDLWRGNAFGKTWMWHVTRRAWDGDKAIIISKDGNLKPVQNFSPEQVAGGFKTNVGEYRSTPEYTMILPISACENWSLLHTFLSGSHG